MHVEKNILDKKTNHFPLAQVYLNTPPESDRKRWTVI